MCRMRKVATLHFMPELPEVTTIVRELQHAVRGKIIADVTVEAAKLVRPLTVADFRRAVRGTRFTGFERRAKFIIAYLGKGARGRGQKNLRTSSKPQAPSPRPQGLALVWHMGMTGHPLYRDPHAESRRPRLRTAMADPMNRHVRVTFRFADGTRLEYSDVRKFGKVELVRAADLPEHPQLRKLGPDAMEVSADPTALCRRLRARRTAVKVALLDQTVLGGIGNIYADEALWVARLHPLVPTQRLTGAQCRTLARAIHTVLQEAIRAHGTSVDDYRRLSGGKGRYGDRRRAYQRTGLPCPRCGTLITRLVVGGRGTHVCPRCQRRATGAANM